MTLLTKLYLIFLKRLIECESTDLKSNLKQLDRTYNVNELMLTSGFATTHVVVSVRLPITY